MNRLPDGEYWQYLRKSRADEEAEARGEGETLSKHRRALFRLAKDYSINVTRVFEEIASGESLNHRPEMQKLLKDIETHRPAGVLVMDVDRLGRGNMQEQGLILETFRRSDTLIITPRKVYDLNDEFDEEYSEFEAFMARKELKIINRRMQGGRIRSVEEGNYIATRPPYGYLIHKEGRSRFLIPHPEQAQVVRMIFEWYTSDDPKMRMGSNKIAAELNRLNIKTYTGKKWTSPSVLVILKNGHYIGNVMWKKKEITKSSEPGKKRDTRTRPESEWIVAKGKHEPLISEDMFEKAQEILKSKYHVPYQLINGITNPLAGLIMCAKCGSSMVYRPYTNQPAHIMCYNQLCKNRSSRFEYVEDRLIESLENWLNDYKMKWRLHKRKDTTSDLVQLKETALSSLQRELKELEQQKLKLHDFLERGIYDEETYLERSRNLSERIENTIQSIANAEVELQEEKNREKAQTNIIPTVQKVIKLYKRTDNPAKKNTLLKSVLLHATYNKEKTQRNDEFTLILHPRNIRIRS